MRKPPPALACLGVHRFAAAIPIALLLAPLRAHAEERDPAEIGHAIGILGLITALFLGCLALTLWLLFVRLRDSCRERHQPTPPPPSPRHPDLERLWFPQAPKKRKAS
jgi:hypothetical protein